MKNKILTLGIVILSSLTFIVSFGSFNTQTARYVSAGFDASKCKEDFGNSCIDDQNKPRCKSSYSESCGDGCNRSVKCGGNGEFKTGPCECQNKKPTCPVATIWNGSKCKGTAKGTDDETKDQDPEENGGEKIAKKDKKPNDSKVRVEGNKQQDIPQGGTGGPVSNASLARLNENLAIEAANQEAFNQCAGSCATKPNVDQCITQCRRNIPISDTSCSSPGYVRTKCSASTVSSSIGANDRVASVRGVLENGKIMCRGLVQDATTGENMSFNDEVGVCSSDTTQRASGSNEPPIGTTLYFDDSVVAEPAIISQTAINLLVEAGLDPDELRVRVRASCAGLNIGSQCEVDQYNQYLTENDVDTTGVTLVTGIDIARSVGEGARGNVFQSAVSAFCAEVNCNHDNVISIMFNSESTCNDIHGISEDASDCLISSVDEYIDQEGIEAVDYELNCDIFADGNRKSTCSALEPDQLDIYNRLVEKAQKDAELLENEDTSGYNKDNNFFRKLVPKVNAQSEAPSPVVIDINDLDSGKYSIKDKDEVFTQLELLGSGRYSLQFYFDANNDGIKQEDEVYLNNEILGFTVSKEKDYSTYELQAGWNAITLDSINEDYNTAKELILEMQKQGVPAVQISKYSAGSWAHFIARYSDDLEFTTYGTDFNIVPGEGYLLRTLEAGNILLEGNIFTSSVPIALANGWNLIGVQSPDKAYSAESFINACSNQGALCKNISKYENERYQSFVEDEGQFFGNNFDLLNTEGYFVLNEGENKAITP